MGAAGTHVHGLNPGARGCSQACAMQAMPVLSYTRAGCFPTYRNAPAPHIGVVFQSFKQSRYMLSEFAMIVARQLRHMLRFAAVIIGLAVVVVAPPAAATADLTDLWWNPAEPGWGVTFVQSENFIFATFFVYDAATKPVWYTGEMSRDLNGIWTGPLFLTSGSYFGAPYNPSMRGTTKVGMVTFVASDESTGTLSYNVETVTVAKALQRQSLQAIYFGGSYMGAVITDTYNCNDGSPVRTARRFADLSVTQVIGGSDRISFSFAQGGACTFNGAAVQWGRLFRMDNATYSCGTGPATVYELKATSLGFEGRWAAPVAGGCTEYGVFSTVAK